MKACEPFVKKESDFYPYTPSPTAKKLFFYPICFGHYIYEPGYHLARSSYDSFLLLYVLSGTLYVNQGQHSVTATKNQVILLNCYLPHSYGTSVGCEALWLHYDGLLARPWYEELSKTTHILYSDIHVPSIHNNLLSLYHSFQAQKLFPESKISDLISSSLSELFQKTTATYTSSDFIKEQTLPYIAAHLTEELSLSDLASHAALSPYYFLRLFKKQTGLTPHNYILTARIDMAKYLLKTSSLPIKEIAFRSGFTTESAFCNSFYKKTSLTPSAYRGALTT
ncbi:MAG: AraC family transcriptional regulator [Lachnospiraceae bacterium]|nr:AraC family transcriptional regulator [Lachnospiraceae bacterium]